MHPKCLDLIWLYNSQLSRQVNTNVLYIYLQSHTNIQTKTHTYVYTHMHMRADTYMHTYRHTDTHTYPHARTHTHTHTHTHTPTRTYTHTYTCTPAVYSKSSLLHLVAYLCKKVVAMTTHNLLTFTTFSSDPIHKGVNIFTLPTQLHTFTHPNGLPVTIVTHGYHLIG